MTTEELTTALDAHAAASEPTPEPTASEPFAESTPDEPTPAVEPAAAPEAEADAEAAKPKRTRKAKAKADEETAPTTETPPPAAEADGKKHWYVVKVASGQEDSIKARLERNIKINNLEEFVSQIVIPVERVQELKKVTKKNEDGEKVTKEKRVIKEKKKYPGYLMAEVEYNDQVQFLFRETPGVGDFIRPGANKPPTPMTDYEVQRMLGNEVSQKDAPNIKGKPAKIKVNIDLEKGDKVRLRDGAFAGTEGEVQEILEAKDETDTPKITVKVQFWGRDVKIDNLEFWQVDKV
jgi:transcription termination/antitermination protein NusG